MSADERGDYIAGLRELADILESTPDLPLPYFGRGTEMLWIEHGDSDHSHAIARTFVRAIPGEIRKDVREQDGAFDLYGAIRGLSVQMILQRDAMCTRVVKGVREVTEEIPDPDAPTVTVTRTVEDVEWVCAPLLSEAVS